MNTQLARRALPGAVLSGVVGVILIVMGAARSSPLRIGVGVVVVVLAVVIVLMARRVLTQAGERFFQVTVPPR